MPASSTEGEGSIRTVEKRDSKRRDSLAIKRGRDSIGTSLMGDQPKSVPSWHPLQTPRLKVSLRLRKRLNSA